MNIEQTPPTTQLSRSDNTSYCPNGIMVISSNLISSNLNPRNPSQPLRAGLAVIGGLFAAYMYFSADNTHAESKDSAPILQ
jgi:hypothetical protein